MTRMGEELLSRSRAMLRQSNLQKAQSSSTREVSLPIPSSLTETHEVAGPGGSGTGAAYRIGPIIDLIMNGTHDILGFDPRGINMTLPRVRCMESLSTRAELQDILGSTAPGLNNHDVGIWDAFGQLIAEECQHNSGDVLSFVNTPSAVRDIISISDALQKQSNSTTISYWGFSYGTNIGSHQYEALRYPRLTYCRCHVDRNVSEPH
jgi:hypothetical protein